MHSPFECPYQASRSPFDDSLYPIEPVLADENEVFVETVAQYGYSILPEDIDCSYRYCSYWWCSYCILLVLVLLDLDTARIGLLGLLVLMWLILHLHLVLYRWLLLGLILLPLLLLGFYAALKLLIRGLFLCRLLLIWLLLQIATARIVLAKRTPKLNMPMRIYQMEDCIQFTTERMLSLSGRRWEFFCSFSCQLKLYFPPHPA